MDESILIDRFLDTVVARLRHAGKRTGHATSLRSAESFSSPHLRKGLRMTADQFISIAGQVATWVTALLVLLTLREMANQRRYAYKPDLVPVDGTIYAYPQRYGTLKLPTRWREQQLSDEEMKTADGLIQAICSFIPKFGAWYGKKNKNQMGI